jgi:tetratricopeptide (TPR) repeat protein
MKFKPLYLYIILSLIAVTILFILTQENNPKISKTESVMPQDDLHKGLLEGTTPPGRGNVSEDVLKQLELLRKSVEENPNDTAKIREYADFLAAAHKPDQAITEYEKILKKYPSRTDIISAIAFIHYKNGEYAEAEKLINKVLSINKDDVQALYNLGAIAANQGDFAKAKIIWTKIVKEYPESELTELAKSSLNRL